MKVKMHALIPYTLGIIIKDNKILMLKRSSANQFAPGHYSLPGGKLEKGESFKQALQRELAEELGITVKENDLEFIHIFYRVGTDGELVAVVFKGLQWLGTPINKEPHKHEELKWIPLDTLPNNVVPAHKKVLNALVTGDKYSEFL
jgi:8-oxo-dGTP diphosphatase